MGALSESSEKNLPKVSIKWDLKMIALPKLTWHILLGTLEDGSVWDSAMAVFSLQC